MHENTTHANCKITPWQAQSAVWNIAQATEHSQPSKERCTNGNRRNLVQFFNTLAAMNSKVAPCVTSLMCFPRAMVEVNVAKNRKRAPATSISFKYHKLLKTCRLWTPLAEENHAENWSVASQLCPYWHHSQTGTYKENCRRKFGFLKYSKKTLLIVN